CPLLTPARQSFAAAACLLTPNEKNTFSIVRKSRESQISPSANDKASMTVTPIYDGQGGRGVVQRKRKNDPLSGRGILTEHPFANALDIGAPNEMRNEKVCDDT